MPIRNHDITTVANTVLKMLFMTPQSVSGNASVQTETMRDLCECRLDARRGAVA